MYLTLELPKQIINGAIGSDTPEITTYGMTFSQIEYLLILCGCFLAAVLAHGLLKMRINTMKGVLAERLLRRFRYTLIARILRFPQPYFERTSQGELVSMVTAESEPMGGLMGDALAQPVLQAGQMLTILGFLFAQSVTFGLAACALIPLQAWLIPKLQRQINKLNKQRVIQVRALAAEIGESAAGASTLRTHAGWRFRLAMITDRLGKLYALRFEIYQKKFFMKFLNNFITQLTPLLFYSIGGYLVIQGEVTLGALVAALAAYKDLAGPWKELLAYYNQSQDMAVRWETITDRFAPAGMVDEALITDAPETMPRLDGDIILDSVTVRDADGNPVLEDLNATLPGGALIGVAAPSDEDRKAFGDLLTRELVPSSGHIQVSGQDLNALHQISLATRIGHATSRPVLFQGSFADNLLMSIRAVPLDAGSDIDFAFESVRAGNSADMLSANWTDPSRGARDSLEALEDAWCEIVENIGGAGALFRRAMDQVLDPDAHGALADSLIALRGAVRSALQAKGLEDAVHVLDPDTYCPALPVVQNLLFATPRSPLLADALAERLEYLHLFKKLGLEKDLMDLALAVMDGLRQIFGSGGTDHPLFQKTGLDPEIYDSVLGKIDDLRAGKPVEDESMALILSVPSSITAEQVGPAFPKKIRENVLKLRAQHGATLRDQMADMFAPIGTDQVLCGFTILENALFGKISDEAGPKGEAVRQVVADVLRDNGVSRQVLRLVFDVPISLGGANLPATFAEPLAVSRAVIKRPDILVLDKVMSSFAPEVRVRMITALRAELPNATLFYLAPTLEENLEFDLTLEIAQGRLTGGDSAPTAAPDGEVTNDLTRKVQALKQTALFAALDRKQIRLLAFGARWYRTDPGRYVFHKNDAPDSGAFLILEGEADLLLPKSGEDDQVIATVGPGALVGELGLIRNEPRALDMRAKSELRCLRLGVEEFMAVVENDAATSFKILQVVAGYVRT
ncbi:MAG: ABC transporter transmembrane domain-containing protein [Paracoccaceae bacterium]